MIKKILILVGFVLVVLALSATSPKSATAQPGGPLIPQLLIDNPCGSVAFYYYPGNSPPQVHCQGWPGLISGETATINVPVPRIIDKLPDLSIVGLPTYFNVYWDQYSFGYKDLPWPTQAFAYPEWDPHDSLYNVRIEVRLVPRAAETPPDGIAMGNLAISNPSPDQYEIYEAREIESIDYMCDPDKNSLINLGLSRGGWFSCGYMRLSLDRPTPWVLYGELEERYRNWGSSPWFTGESFGLWTPYASISGTGSVDGNPAYQMVFHTFWDLEARAVWDKHEVKHEWTEVECSWDYWNDYDFIDWERFPDPVFCKNIPRWEWRVLCIPENGDCPYGPGPADTWWRNLASIESTMFLNPEGDYDFSYQFQVIQSQPLLSPP